MAASDDALRVQTTAGLDVRHRAPAAIGVGREIADRMEQADAVLAVDIGARRHVLAHERPGLGVVEVGHRRCRQDRTTGDVVQVTDHQAVVGGAGVLASVRVQLVREGGAERPSLGMAQRRLQAGADHRRMDDHLGDLLLDVPLAGQAVGLGDELRQADEQVGAISHRRQAAKALPQPERVGEHRCVRHLAVQEDALLRHEHVVEDDEALGIVVLARDGEVADIGMARRIGGVDDLHPGRVDGDHGGNGVVLFARLHRLGRDRHQLVTERRARDVELGAADHDAVAGTIDDMDVSVGIVLLAGRTGAITLGVGDALRDAYVATVGFIDEGVHLLDVVR